MVLSLKYGDLSSAISQSNKLATELDQYCNDLSKKVQQKMYSAEGGMNSRLNNADYYVRTKITQLRTRQRNATSLAGTIQTLHDTAKRVDDDVKKTIESNQASFFKKNPDLKAPWYQQAWTSFMCDMKKVPILGSLIKGGEDFLGAMDELWNGIRYWWECGGGKQLVMNCLDIVLKITLAVAAVIIAVSAVIALVTATVLTGGAILFAVAACIAAVIAVANAVTNTVTSVQAMQSGNEHPAMAKIYSQRDTLAQVLREENFGKKWNRISYLVATGIEITDAICGVIMLVQSIGKIANSFLGKNGVGFAFKQLVRGSDGKLTTKVTISSIWKGTKALILNQKLTTSTASGLRTTLLSNIGQSLKYQGTLLKMALKNPSGWLKMKQVGDLGFFGNIHENLRYNLTLFKTAKPITQIEAINSITSNVTGKTKSLFDRLTTNNDKGFFRGLSENIVQKSVFNNDFSKLLDKTGIGGSIVGLDKTNTAKDYSGFGNGIIQKIGDIKKSFQTPVLPSFQTQFPHFQCIGGY